ncbi:MAG: RIP metalloprotease RseP [Acidobacteriota bacterium]|nr:RIP metalloprotease RseP [Acidobacteriota bacterium]
MESFLIAVVSMAVVLGIMILVHEFGHYAAAKYFGVRVDVFSLGFGKRLTGFRRNGTDYRISALPLGGYVKMAGESPLESRTGAPDEFMSHPRWQRFVIAIAGPAMNIILAVALLTGVFMVHYEHPVFLDQPAVVGWVLDNSPAAKASIQQGDRIVRIDGVQNPTWEDVMLKVMVSPKQPVEVAVQHGNEILDKKIQPEMDSQDQVGAIGWLPDQPITITELEPQMPAAMAGLKVGDDVVAVNGTQMRSLYSVIHLLQQNGSKSVDVTAVRNGEQMHYTITPVQTEEGGQKSYRLGFRSEPVHVDKLPFAQALNRSLDENKKYSLLIVDLVRKMLERKVSIKQMEGPIGIARASGDAARQPGWTPLLGLMAMISLNLGIFNLLPIPILDGGVILLLIIEAVIRRDINVRIKERIYQTAFVFLLLFFVVVIYNDLMKALPGLAQRLP